MTFPDLRETADALEIAWVLWELALVPFKVNNLREAWADWRAQSAIPRAERDAGQYIVAFGTWWMDVSVAVILVSFLLVGLAALITPPPVRRDVIRLSDYAGLLFLVANGGLTGLVMMQWWMRHEWRLYASPAVPALSVAPDAPAPPTRKARHS